MFIGVLQHLVVDRKQKTRSKGGMFTCRGEEETLRPCDTQPFGRALSSGKLTQALGGVKFEKSQVTSTKKTNKNQTSNHHAKTLSDSSCL